MNQVFSTSYTALGFEHVAFWRDEPPADTSAKELFLCFGRKLVSEIAFAGLVVAGLAEAIVRFIVAGGLFSIGFFSPTYKTLAEECLQSSTTCCGFSFISLYSFFTCMVYPGNLVDRIV